MSKAKLSASEWNLVKDAPFWVNAALSAADGRVALIVKRKENKAVSQAMDAYKGSNQLVRDVIANEEDPDKDVKNATQSQAEKALSRISGIVEKKLGADDLDAFNTFLLSVGRAVAEAAGEGVLGIGKNTSDEESEALKDIAEALQATPAHKQARRQAKQAAEKAEREAKAKAAAEAKAKAEAAAKAKAEAAAKAKAEAAAKVKAEADAKAKAAAEAKAEAKREAKQEAQKQKREEALEARKQERAQEKAEREAEAKAKAEEEAKQKTARKSRFTQFIAEHKVVSGENLSFISEKYYNTQANWRLIYEANEDVIGDNPNLIRVGQVLKIPKL